MTDAENKKCLALYASLKRIQKEHLERVIPPHRNPTAEEYNDSLLHVFCGAILYKEEKKE